MHYCGNKGGMEGWPALATGALLQALGPGWEGMGRGGREGDAWGGGGLRRGGACVGGGSSGGGCGGGGRE
jgi:hypothetical protein